MKLRHIDTAILLLVGMLAVPVLHATAAESKAESGPAERTGRNTGQYIDDAAVTTRVKVALLSDNLLSAFEVKVSTQSGIVTLSGEVDKAETIQRAIKVASAIPGVKAINTHLMVKVASFTVGRSTAL
ncbi:MAG TPA: BON domain-containing protein [Rhodocyclaceae bacterium]|nr:BON domain-containing protein [Rhodocyclaceae bacterium]